MFRTPAVINLVKTGFLKENQITIIQLQIHPSRPPGKYYTAYS